MSLSNRRSNVLLACVTALLATPANAATAGSRLSAIPAEFHGEWRENPDQCGDRTETGLDISARSLEYYSYTPAMNSIRQAGPRSILVTQTVQRDELGGTVYSRDEVITYEISADGRTLNETDTSGYTVSRVRCGAAQTVAPAPTQIAIDSLIGEWWDGRAACASIRRGRAATSIVFRGWYCETGEDSATPITLERLGDRVFAHRATDLSVVVHSNRQMNADAGPQSRRRFGDGLFVTEAGQLYGRRAASSGPATVERARGGSGRPVTQRELSEWQGSGNSYGYLCTVTTNGGPLTLRSVPRGSQSGSLRSGEQFLLAAVRVTTDGETWYRADPLERRIGGWVSARFAACNREHFN